ncbi:hypothetical protein B0W47_17660 (plasmid) [Komagataeibacter nataicola]|uniref:Helix-turn-helix domain-containing protein n=1 Tax=Komagataeibacter nataicola TaxID=265960 RepID=A0A9N7CCS5_9PROT|nr:hypothetical protein [Komagataeibacter nataicola]AQU89381.1 hypothetical protein B0W47_17660 [Komagataeibacter nataicola]PYD65245.1 hypothetical protein CDI09_14735 [Komagataeibacter nataicola]WNM07326.1 hypothetical protein RI056_00350 [Komagataeibacter nataicola]
MTTRSLYTKQQSNDVVATIFDAFDNGSITLHMKQALINLFQILKSGNNSPTQRHVANKARISLRTVSEAIRVAKALGLVLVVPQYEIVKGRPRRLANRYVFNALKELPEGISYKRKRCAPYTKPYIKEYNSPVDNSGIVTPTMRDRVLGKLLAVMREDGMRV